MLNSAASALVNIDPAGTTRDETIGRNLASEYSNIHGKSESLREQLQSLNMVNREDMNDRVKMGSQSKTKEDGSAKRSQPVGNVTQRKETSPGTEKNKRILPMTPGTASTAASGTAMTPKSLYSTPSQPAPSTVSSSEKTISKRSSTSSLSSASNTSSVSSEGPEDELRLTDTKQTHIVVYKFVARHDDEINLEIGDAVHVDKKCEDLWFEGINLRTGKAGIFPSRYVSDILQQTSIQDNSNGAQVNQFSVRFLGSVEVNGFKGNEIICDAMRQIVKQHQLTSTARPPACILDVTERGIRITEHPVAGQRRDSASSKKSRKGKLGKIFEKESKEPPKSHYFALKNVTFCGCHPHNARFFAFITKHPEDHRFACHVFMSEFSTEPVASAIGRAFKKFYADFLDYQAPVEDFYIE